MLAARSRFASIAKCTFTTEAAAAAKPDKKYKVVVVGAGPGGLSVLSKMLGKDQVAVINPADYHYYVRFMPAFYSHA